MVRKSTRHFYDGLYNIRFISYTAVHCVLDIVKIKYICYDSLEIHLAGGYGVYSHGIYMAIAENRFESEFLIQSHAHGKSHFSGFAISNENDRSAFFRHLNSLSSGDFRAGSFDY